MTVLAIIALIKVLGLLVFGMAAADRRQSEDDSFEIILDRAA